MLLTVSVALRIRAVIFIEMKYNEINRFEACSSGTFGTFAVPRSRQPCPGLGRFHRPRRGRCARRALPSCVRLPPAPGHQQSAFSLSGFVCSGRFL